MLTSILSPVKPTRLSREDIIRLGKDPDSPSLVRFKEEDGGGYMASIEVTHQLHCLVRVKSHNIQIIPHLSCIQNFLRKYTYHSHYETFDPIFTSPKPETFRNHLGK